MDQKQYLLILIVQIMLSINQVVYFLAVNLGFWRAVNPNAGLYKIVTENMFRRSTNEIRVYIDDDDYKDQVINAFYKNTKIIGKHLVLRYPILILFVQWGLVIWILNSNLMLDKDTPLNWSRMVKKNTAVQTVWFQIMFWFNVACVAILSVMYIWIWLRRYYFYDNRLFTSSPKNTFRIFYSLFLILSIGNLVFFSKLFQFKNKDLTCTS